ncbi:MAG: hypothetical protein J2P31_07580 [Blastocatellia bacterium]|nr:hypothetical protein [Blastocatellia bacterium]
MPDLEFQVESAAPLRNAAAPTLVFKLQTTNNAEETIHTILLNCQIMLDVTRRRYSTEEQEKLLDLFGKPELWDRSLRRLFWTNVGVTVPTFTGKTIVDLNVPCTFDINVAATKYFSGLEEGEVPLLLLFSGTIFYEGENQALRVAQIPWEKEAVYRLPVRVWQEMMDIYYPNSVWLNLRRDVFERLNRYKMLRGIPTFDQVLERIVPDASMENGLSPQSKDSGGEKIH